ncbi:LamG-like jellyroll fold domain-containing protein [Colwellia sp. RE-S-Sl-9]
MKAWFVKSNINGVFLIFISLLLAGVSKVTLANNLEHAWAIDEGTGSIVADSTGSNDGSVQGATWITTGYLENALQFNGVSDSVEISGSAINTMSSFSVAAWVKLDSTSGWQTAVSQDGVNLSGFFLQKTQFDKFAFSMLDSDSVTANVIRAEASFNPLPNTWYHLIGMYDATAQEIRLYVNGLLASNQSFTTPWSASGDTAIGRGQWLGENVDYFSGAIDEVKVYNDALSGTEAKNLFSTGNIQGALFSDDFNDGNDNDWTIYDGVWQINDNQYHVNSGPGYKSVADNVNVTDFEYEADITLNSSGNAGVIFRIINPSIGADSFSGYYAGIEDNGNITLGKMDNNWTLLQSVAAGIKTGVTYRLKVIAIGSNLQVYLDGIPQININDTSYTSGSIGVRSFMANSSFDNLIVKAASDGNSVWIEPVWTKGTAALMTDFSNNLSPDNVHQDYPRMQMTRTEWDNLNGIWQVKEGIAGEILPSNQNFPQAVLVPFAIESALSGVMQGWDHLWYRKVINIPTNWHDQRILLHFGAVDFESEVFVNGQSQGIHKGGYDSFSYDITDSLNSTGNQEIIVRVFDDTGASSQAIGKQAETPHDIFYTATTGIWQTVWMEPVPASHIDSIKLTPNIDNNTVSLIINVKGDTNDLLVDASITSEGMSVASAIAQNVGSEFTITIPNPTLWSPDNPFLYDLKIDLKNGNSIIDSVGSYFGMRKISIVADGGYQKMYLNNQFLFQRGPLDQGYWPDGIMTAPNDAALKYDLEITKKLGFNMTRKHIKVEPDRWYYWADKLGLLVWQDMPSRNLDLRGNEDVMWEQELQIMMEKLHNHPSIIMWVIFNEQWGQFLEEGSNRVTDWAISFDPSRVVSQTSGWEDYNGGHVKDSHCYPGPCVPTDAETAGRVKVNGEYGGITYEIPNHLWQIGGGHTYAGQVFDDLNFFESYGSKVKTLYEWKDTQGLSAYVYTQLTDVEGEENGLLTYDRKRIKGNDLARLKKLNQGIPLTFNDIVPSAKNQAISWQYTTTAPSAGWQAVEFNDSSWKTGDAGFGTVETPGTVVRTVWNTADLWMRQTFILDNLNSQQLDNLYFEIHHDDEALVYINGILAGEFNGYTSGYSHIKMTAAAKAALNLGGNNVISVHTHQTIGGQYADIGIVEMVQ